VTVGGKAFLARVYPEELMAGKEAAIKMEYFGEFTGKRWNRNSYRI